jgi:hypothetical protein
LCFRGLGKKKYYFDCKEAKATVTITENNLINTLKPPQMILIAPTATTTTRIITKAKGTIPC